MNPLYGIFTNTATQKACRNLLFVLHSFRVASAEIPCGKSFTEVTAKGISLENSDASGIIVASFFFGIPGRPWLSGKLHPTGDDPFYCPRTFFMRLAAAMRAMPRAG